MSVRRDEPSNAKITERPILFSAPMVRALLDGRKTQTRRIVKGTAADWLADGFTPDFIADAGNAVLCPYGAAGDHLWVREAWSPDWSWRNDKPREIIPCAPIWYWADGNPTDGDWTRPKPSIHMPRWASRITLKVTDIRVQRLQEISEADALAEGITLNDISEYVVLGVEEVWQGTAQAAYQELWNHINGPKSWAANPWVWAVSFERLMPGPAPLQGPARAGSSPQNRGK